MAKKTAQSAYTDMMTNLAKSSVAVPLHLQKATDAIAWWQSDDSLLAKSEIAPAEGALEKAEPTMAKTKSLAIKTGPHGKTWELVHVPAGWHVAGSGKRHQDHDTYLVRLHDNGTTHGRHYRSLDEAQAAFDEAHLHLGKSHAEDEGASEEHEVEESKAEEDKEEMGKKKHEDGEEEADDQDDEDDAEDMDKSMAGEPSERPAAKMVSSYNHPSGAKIALTQTAKSSMVSMVHPSGSISGKHFADHEAAQKYYEAACGPSMNKALADLESATEALTKSLK